MPTNLKCVVVGDGCVGKTSLLITHVYGKFPEEYTPTSVDACNTRYNVDGSDVLLHFWDTAGGEDYWRLRPLSYPGSDVMLICFSVENRVSFENITEYWYPELQKHIPEVPTVLVGCKSDLRAKDDISLVSYQEAKAVAEKFGALYFETSALYKQGLTECMESAMTIGLNHYWAQPPTYFWDRWCCVN